MKKAVITVSIISVMIMAIVSFFMLDERKRIKDEFSEYENPCTYFVEFLLKDFESANQEKVFYSVNYKEDKYKLYKTAGDERSEINLSSVYETYLKQTDEVFFHMTGQYPITYIYVSKNYVVFWEESYGGKLIFSADGRIDDADRKTSQNYQVFRKINDHWYAVHINAL